MNFLGGLLAEMERRSLSKAEIITMTKIPRGRFYSWFEPDRNSIPNAHDAYTIAKALGTTVEYLVTGEAPKTWFPPKIATIIEDLKMLDDGQLSTVGAMIHGLAEAQRATGKTETAG